MLSQVNRDRNPLVISLGNIMQVVTACVSIVVWYFLIFNSNYYIGIDSAVIITIESIVLIISLRISQKNSYTLLSLFLFNYTIFWHLRHATLSIFPEFPGVLQRTVFIGKDEYFWGSILCLIGLLSAIFGGIFSYSFFKNRRNTSGKKLNSSHDFVSKCNSIISFSPVIIIYGVMGVVSSVVITQVGIDNLTYISRYALLLFNTNVTFFLLTVVFFYGVKKQKYYSAFFLIVYGVLQTLHGSRSGILSLIIVYVILYYILFKDLKFKITVFRLLTVSSLIPLMIITFMYGTIQRNLRNSYGLKIDAYTIGYVLKHMQFDDIESIIGMAASRAGYSNYSMEIVNNPKFSTVITIKNISRSIFDNSLPGNLLKDSQRVSYKLKQVRGVNYHWAGYHSDAIGVIGENYTLFGGYFFVIIAFIMFVLVHLFLSLSYRSPTLLSLYILYILADTTILWWNSFGYDWVFIESTRNIVIGIVVIFILDKLGNISQCPSVLISNNQI